MISLKEFFGVTGTLFFMLLIVFLVRFFPLFIQKISIKIQEAIYSWGSSGTQGKKQRK
jgi:hypothetical protein